MIPGPVFGAIAASSQTITPPSGYALELLFEGADGSTTFLDTSPNARTITAFGNAQISTARFAQGSSSGLFDGSGDYLGFTWAMPPLTGNLSISAYIYPVTSVDMEVFCLSDSTQFFFNLLFEFGADNSFRFNLRDDLSNSYFDLNSGINSLTLNTWHKVEGIVIGNSAFLYVNDVLKSSTTFSGTRQQGLTFARVGSLAPARSGVERYWNGNLDALIISIP